MLGLDYPVRWVDFPLIYGFAGKEWPKPLDTLARGSKRKPKALQLSRSDIHEAASGMSDVFASLYR